MGAPKACLGYRSRTEAVLTLRRQGLTTAEIAERTGIDAGNIPALEQSAARSIARSAQPRPDTAVLLPPRIMEALKPHAERRRIKPGFLAFLILETVVAEKLVDSVLDDLSSEVAA
jgi:hypothetical protein